MLPWNDPEMLTDDINFKPIYMGLNFIGQHLAAFITVGIILAAIFAVIKIFLYLGDKQVEEFIAHSKWSNIQQWIDHEINTKGVDPRRTSFVRWLYFCVFRAR